MIRSLIVYIMLVLSSQYSNSPGYRNIWMLLKLPNNRPVKDSNRLSPAIELFRSGTEELPVLSVCCVIGLFSISFIYQRILYLRPRNASLPFPGMDFQAFEGVLKRSMILAHKDKSSSILYSPVMFTLKVSFRSLF